MIKLEVRIGFMFVLSFEGSDETIALRIPSFRATRPPTSRSAPRRATLVPIDALECEA
jgi:hypothetical protein